ncbi:hypothetical protein [Nocardia jejuensis]|uniref:hypothetical protein n=1 Tax=Nocardia jejuensis TaxID=328049 RepID=UPI00082AAFB5|nr:hypothetical protein [Nocardia jejuensis]
MAEFAALSDELVRNLFDARLRVDRARSSFDCGAPTAAEILQLRAALEEILDGLDTMIRDTGLAMLELTSAVPMSRLTRRRGR